MSLTKILPQILSLFVKGDALEFFLSLHDLLVGLLLHPVEASHEQDQGEEDTNGHHEEHKGFIVEIVRRECRLDLHVVGHLTILLLRQSIADLLEPACVVKNDEHLVMHLVFGQKAVI